MPLYSIIFFVKLTGVKDAKSTAFPRTGVCFHIFHYARIYRHNRSTYMYDSLLNETNKKVDFLCFHVLCHAYPESHLKEKLRSKIGIFFSSFIFALEHKVGIFRGGGASKYPPFLSIL